MKNVVLLRSNPVRPYPRLEKMANCLRGLGYGVHVLAWDRDADYLPKEDTLVLRDSCAKITRVGIKGQFSGGFKKNLRGLIKFQLYIVGWLFRYRKQYDIIHAYDFDTGFTAGLCAKLLRKSFIYDIPDYYVDSHGMTSTRLGRLVKKLENSTINRADATVICTEERRHQIAESDPKELVVVHNTPQIDVPVRTMALQHTRIKLVYVGIFGKGRLLEEMCQCIASRDDYELHIAGYGANMEQFFEQKAKNSKNIYYYGRIPYNETIKLETESDVMCAIYDPSVANHKYAAPNKFYEALALGKPLIMVKNTGMASVVEQYGIGELIEYSLSSLNAALDRLQERKDEFTDISIKARELYEKLYSWNEMEKRISVMYKKIEE